MESFEFNNGQYVLTRAVEADLPALVALLADDVLGAQRESPDLEPYRAAFHDIDRDPNQLLVTVRDREDNLVGTVQLTLIPGLSRAGARRLQIEGVRLASSVRGSGLGTALFEWVHAFGRRHGAVLAQLTSDKTRADAQRFYAALGYEASHEGFKRPL